MAEESKLPRCLGFIFDDMRDSFNKVVAEIESPIEDMLCAALLSEAILQTSLVVFQGKDDGISFGGKGPDIIRIFPQHKIGKYRVDFWLEYLDTYSGKTKNLIVECDEHDFHEKTKEQAQRDKSRDRILQKYAAVFRFTGSEIWAAAHDCVYQIMDFLTKEQET